MDNKQKYKRKNYYKPSGGEYSSWGGKKKIRNFLLPGMKGFLCTCNSKSREKDCVRESLNILNEYADKLFGPDDIQRATKVEGAIDEERKDIEDELKTEISNLRASQWTPGRFSVVDTTMPAIIFIRTTLENPVKLAHTALTDVAATKVQKARFLLRMVPVEVTCKANLEDIKTAADALFDSHFRCEPTTFAVHLNKRFNNSVLRDEVIHSLALLVTDKNKEHKANLKEPQHTVLVEIFKGLCCMSVLEDFQTLRRYNIAELTKSEQSGSENPEYVEGMEENEGDVIINHEGMEKNEEDVIINHNEDSEGRNEDEKIEKFEQEVSVEEGVKEVPKSEIELKGANGTENVIKAEKNEEIVDEHKE